MFRGIYHGKAYHTSDTKHIIERAVKAGVRQILMTGTSLESSRECVEMATQLNKSHGEICWRTTVGCHPTECNKFLKSESEYMSGLRDLIESGCRSGVVSAIGEIGLDYDRLHFCERQVQTRCFGLQLKELSSKFPRLPFFLHFRDGQQTGCIEDFISIINSADKPIRGCVHSFTGTQDEMQRILDAGLYIGINGCSLKAEQNIEVVKQVPVDRLMIETDSPWCSITTTSAGYQYLDAGKYSHLFDADDKDSWTPPVQVKKEKHSTDSMVKGRNEPCSVRSVLRAIAAIKSIPETQLASTVYDNSQLFFSRHLD